MKRLVPILGLLTVLLAGGCGRSPFAEWIDGDRPLATRLREADRSTSRTAGYEAVVPEQGGPEAYVRLALRRNPAIRAAEQKVRRLANRIPQVTSLDDPVVRIAPFGEMAETAAGQVSVMTGVSQKLPLPAKLDARGRIAGQAVAEAVQELERVRLEVVGDTRRAWWSFYYATRAIEVTQRNGELLSQFRDVAEAKYGVGTATQQDVLRASLEMSNLDNELIVLQQRQTTARAMLNRMIDRPVASYLPVPVPRKPDAFELRLEELLAQARKINPRIHMVRERIEGWRERRELARLNRWPDLTVSFNYNLVDGEGLSAIANGEDQWWVGFGVNLPIWADRLAAAEHEATRGILEGLAALDDEQNRVAFRVQDAFARVESEQDQVVLFREVIIPQAQQTVEASISGYRAGSLEFLTLVDNWRRLLDFRLMYHRTLARLEQSFAELQEAVGQDLPRRGLGGGPDATHDHDPQAPRPQGATP